MQAISTTTLFTDYARLNSGPLRSLYWSVLGSCTHPLCKRTSATMSWEGYIEHLMVDLPGGGKLDAAAIVGQDGGVWAQSPTFPAVTPEQIKAIMLGFASMEKLGHAGDLGSTGIMLGEDKFQVAPGDESVMRGKSLGGGCCIKKTATALVIGIYKEPVQAGDCNVVVETLGDYLLNMQY